MVYQFYYNREPSIDKEHKYGLSCGTRRQCPMKFNWLFRISSKTGLCFRKIYERSKTKVVKGLNYNSIKIKQSVKTSPYACFEKGQK